MGAWRRSVGHWLENPGDGQVLIVDENDVLRDAVAGRSFVDPDVEERILEVRHRDEQDPMSLL